MTSDRRSAGKRLALRWVVSMAIGSPFAMRSRSMRSTRPPAVMSSRSASRSSAVMYPMSIETTHLSAKRFPALRRSLVKYTSLYTALAEVYDVHLAEAEETIETSLATPREAGLLGTDVGLPMLMLSRHSLDREGQPVEWVRSVYRGDRYKFVARLKRPQD